MPLDIMDIGVTSFTTLYKNRNVLILAIIGSAVSVVLTGLILLQTSTLNGYGSSPLAWVPGFLMVTVAGGIIVYLIKTFLYGAVMASVNSGRDINAASGVAAKRYLTLLVTSIVAGVLAGIGAIFLILPGIYIGLRLSIAPIESVLGGKGVMDSLKSSWSATKGNLWGILGIYILITLITVIISAIFGIAGPLVSSFAGTYVSFAFLVGGTLIYQQLESKPARSKKSSKKR